MILEYDNLKKNDSFETVETSSLITLNAKYFTSDAERNLFSYTVEVLHSMYSLQRIGKEHAITFNVEILHEAISYLFSGNRFSHLQLITYFELQQFIEDFEFTLEDEKQTNFEAHLPYPVDFLLLGMDYEAYFNMGSYQRITLNEQYETLYFQVLQKEISITDFIASAKTMLADVTRG